MIASPRRLPRASVFAASLVALILTIAAPSAVLAGSSPFQDPSARGTLTFCNREGEPMTSGSIYTRPFAWKTVSSVPAPKGYRDSTARASLFAFQPIRYVQPGGWVGTDIIGASSFSNTAHPVDQATNLDQSLLGFTYSYPLHWNGYVQLRMFYSGINQATKTDTYPAAVLKITGTKWTLVSGGGTPCGAGTGVANATHHLPKKLLASPVSSIPLGSPTPPAPAGSGGSSPAPTRSGAAADQPSARSSSSVAPGASLSASSGGVSGGTKAEIVAGVVVLVTALIGGVFWWRRRPQGQP